jgi:hypothetical protein
VNTHTVIAKGANDVKTYNIDPLQESRGVARINPTSRLICESCEVTMDSTSSNPEVEVKLEGKHARPRDLFHGHGTSELTRALLAIKSEASLSVATRSTQDFTKLDEQNCKAGDRNYIEARVRTAKACPNMEARAKDFGGRIQQDTNKCQALNKLDTDKEDYADPKGIEHASKG